MPKLRVAKAREKDIAVQEDLRGLGGEEILEDFAPYAVWTLKIAGNSHQNARAVEQIQKKYQLKKLESSAKDLLFFCVQQKTPGEHKHQAVTLFFASVELQKHCASAQSCLTMHHPLHQHLASGAHGGKTQSQYSPTAKGEQWARSPYCLSLEHEVQFALTQAQVLQSPLTEGYKHYSQLTDMIPSPPAVEAAPQRRRKAV